jgi:predicted ATPase
MWTVSESNGQVLCAMRNIPYRASSKFQACPEPSRRSKNHIEIAQCQQAKSLELRATMSLAQLWQQHSKKEEAHQMLVAVYDWFTEGFDTADLKDAKSLIEELS